MPCPLVPGVRRGRASCAAIGSVLNPTIRTISRPKDASGRRSHNGWFSQKYDAIGFNDGVLRSE